ncbi:hypothetical protein NM688_g5261 [Phlebia brevispora]|uniref:Uncharacterized protein n=1 Tax=Phlebia brevispora TaxID=194682 RepID=A0ACC1SXT8_9APHY|nr:hypothetical protein NM688_g5261 [Phlebia brevispora]
MPSSSLLSQIVLNCDSRLLSLLYSSAQFSCFALSLLSCSAALYHLPRSSFVLIKSSPAQLFVILVNTLWPSFTSSYLVPEQRSDHPTIIVRVVLGLTMGLTQGSGSSLYAIFHSESSVSSEHGLPHKTADNGARTKGQTIAVCHPPLRAFGCYWRTDNDLHSGAVERPRAVMEAAV